MPDIARLGITVDTSGVDKARDSLNNMRGAAASAGASAKDYSSASEQMSRQLQGFAQQQERTNQLLQQTNQHLQSGTISTHSYTDSMVKLATVVAAADLAYRGFSSAIDLAGRGMKEQVSLVSQLATGIQDLAKYGTNAFQLMSDQAINLQKSLIAIGSAVGTSGSAFAAFSQALSRGGATGQQIAGVFPAVQGAIAGTTMEDINRREAMTRMGVSTQGSPADVAAAVMQALRQMAPGPERNVLATQALGPQGADMVNQAMGAIIKVTDLERTYQELREANAKAEIEAAKARQEADQKSREWYEGHPISALLMSMVPGSTAGTVTGMRFGAMQEAIKGSFEELMGRQPGLGFGKDLMSSLGIMFGGQGPGFGEYGKLGQAAAAPPPNLPAGYAAMAGVGLGEEQSFENLAKQSELLTENWQKMGLSSDQLNSALAELAQRMQNVGDPVTQMVTAMQHAASLYQFAPGLPRQTQEALRAAAMKAAPTVGIGPEAAAAMAPEELIQRTGVAAPTSGVSAAVAAQSAGQQRDVLRGLEQATAAIRAQAGAAGGGAMAVVAAGIKAEEAYKVREGLMSAGDAAAQAGEKLTQASLRFEEAGNALIGRGRGAAAQAAAAVANLPVKGVLPPGGILAQAGFEAGQALGLAPGTMLPPARPEVQAQMQVGANQVIQEGKNLLESFQTRTELMRASAGDTTGTSTGALRAQTGITRFENEVDAAAKALQISAQASGGMSDATKTVITALLEMKTGLSAAAAEFVKAQQDMQTKRVMVGAQKELSMAEAKYGAIQGGASPEQIQAIDLFQKFKNALPGEGKAATPEQIAALRQYADSIAAVTAATQSAIAAQKQWTDTLKGVIDNVGTGLESLVYGGKNAKETLRTMMLDISKKGFNYFVEDPLKQAASNLLGIGDQTKGGGGGIFGTAGQGFQSWIGKMTGGALGTTGGGAGGGSLLGKLDATAFGGAAGVTPVYVTNMGLGGGGAGLAGDLGGLAGLGPEGGTNPNGSPDSGGLSSMGFLGSLGNQMSSGWNWLTSGWSAGSTGGLGGMLSGLFDEGGVIGAASKSRYVSPLVFAGAPRFAAGGMIGLNPGEVPIIGHQGEVVLNPRQQSMLNRGGNTTNVHMNVTAGNLDGFRASAPQLAMAMQGHVERAQSRYS